MTEQWEYDGRDIRRVASGPFRGASVCRMMGIGSAKARNAALIATAPAMRTALQSMIVNYAQHGFVSEKFVRDCAALIEGLRDD